jgi:hypothetical protein
MVLINLGVRSVEQFGGEADRGVEVFDIDGELDTRHGVLLSMDATIRVEPPARAQPTLGNRMKILVDPGLVLRVKRGLRCGTRRAVTARRAPCGLA